VNVMISTSTGKSPLWRLARAGVAAATLLLAAACATGSGGAPGQKTFATPEEAAEALVLAAEHFDVDALTEILGPDGVDLVVTEDPVHDRNQSHAFAAEARTQMRIARDPEGRKVAILSVGTDDWPLPIPIVKARGGWRFDTEAGRQEILQRRIGANELDAIEICRGFVEAQHEYALVKRDGALVNQYAQRIISTPGRQDGLAWQDADGTWQGPVGEVIARVIAEGYVEQPTPFHGYFFKVLKGQGPDAPLGELDFVIDGAMIGGFALAAAPADYGVTGVKSFIVSHDGVVYEQDLGPDSLELFRAMERFNPDVSWHPVPEK
jgi:hypothetical protein